MDGQRAAAFAGRSEDGFERARGGDDGGQVVLPDHPLLAGAEGGEHHDGHGEALFTEGHRLLDVGDREQRRSRGQQPARHRHRAMAVRIRLHHRHDGDGDEALQRAVVGPETVEVDARAGRPQVAQGFFERDALTVHTIILSQGGHSRATTMGVRTAATAGMVGCDPP